MLYQERLGSETENLEEITTLNRRYEKKQTGSSAPLDFLNVEEISCFASALQAALLMKQPSQTTIQSRAQIVVIVR